jgi:hypothetical protein
MNDKIESRILPYHRADPAHQKGYGFHHIHNHMITVTAEKYNSISQKFYDDTIESIDYHNLRCTCGHSACLVGHGYYKRITKQQHEEITLRIRRVRCKICEVTHALLLSAIVPYSQVILEDQIEIVKCYEKGSGFAGILNNNLCIDENTIRAIVRRYCHHWEQRLLSYGISLTSPGILIQHCFSAFRRQFMQIRSTRNLLFLKPT